MKYTEDIKRIYNNLKNGEMYGYLPIYREDYPDPEIAGKPYFSPVLWKSEIKPLFCWRYYGQSANKATLHDLKWILEIIFQCDAKQFEERYITKSEARNRNIYNA